MERVEVHEWHDQNVDRYPDECPVCHYAGIPRFVGAARRHPHDKDPRAIQAAFQCCRAECGQMFTAGYLLPPEESLWLLKNVPVVRPKVEEVNAQAKLVSKEFEKIFQQANLAEKHRLHLIAGAGYRKALEFLIKDFCTRGKSPEERAAIETKLLGKVIDDHVDDPRIKTCAKRAAWLGNDETHYLRVWKDKDINDLKTLIKLTVNWVSSAILTDGYEEEMRPPGSPASKS